MKMFRRLSAFAIVLSMVFAMLPAAVSAGTLPEDVKGTKYEEAASLLCALDIMVGDGTNFNADKNVTRAEFAKILVTAMGHLDSASAYAATGVFNDVATGQWYAPFVEFATQLGAINGYGNGKFGPNDNVTGYQAIKMICFASGHNACIEDPIGGYPQEYFNVAKEYGFLKNLSDVNFSVAMTRGQVAILTANVLRADMLRFVSSSSEKGSAYEVMEGVNLLNQKHDVYLFEGLVTENEKTGLFGQSTVLPGEVQIEKGASVGVFKVGECGIENELGTYVKAYYKDDDNAGTKTILSYEISNTKNTKINLEYEHIDIADSNDSTIKYWKDGNFDANTTKMSIAGDAVVIWNGAVSSYTSAIEAIEATEGMQSTSFEFLDYDGDDKIDVISIKAYDTYVVNRIDEKIYTITDEIGDWSTGSKRTKKIKIDIEEADSFITITDVDGEEYEFSDIAEGDVLSVASSEDGSVMDIIISTDVIEGTIASIGRVDGKWVFEIDGEDYQLSSTYFDYISEGDENATVANMKVKIGKSYEFKLDAFGQLAHSDIVETDGMGEFGFITFYAETETADANLKVRMFTDGSVDIYDVADTVKIDGEKLKGSEIITNMDAIKATYIPGSDISGKSGYYGDGQWYGVPVLFDVNDDGKINYIDTPVVGADEDTYTLRPVRTKADGNIFTSKYTSSGFGNSRPVASSLSVIQLPKSDENLNIVEEYSTSKAFNTDDNYYVQLFATDPNSYNASYAVIARGANGSISGTSNFVNPYDEQTYKNNFFNIYLAGLNGANTVNGGNASAGVKTTPLFVVSEVMQAIAGEDDDEATIMITGVENGAEVSYTVDPEYYATGYILDMFKFNLSEGSDLSSKRTVLEPVLEGDVIRVARNKDTGYITYVAPVFYMEEKFYATAIVDGDFDTKETTSYAIDVTTVKEMEGSQGVMSYLMKNMNNRYNKFQLVMEGDRIGTNTDVTMTETGYIGEFSKLMNLKEISKIALYDASKKAGEKVSSGTLSDIITLQDATAEVNPSILILHHRNGVAYSMVIINL